MRGTIICGVTDTAEAQAAAQLAAALATRLDLRLVLVHVVSGPTHRPAAAAHAHEREWQLLGRARERVGRGADDDVEIRVVAGSRVDALAQLAADEGADMIIVGSRPRGARGRQLRCSLARELEAAQTVPVMIAPPATRPRAKQRLALVGAAGAS